MVYKKKENFRMSYIVAVGIVAALMFWLTAAAFGQTTPMPQNTPVTPAATQTADKMTVSEPLMTDYRGIKVGMTADEVRAKLNEKPKVADKTGFYYVFSDDESAQIALDKNKKVRVISVIYSGKNATAPKYEDVFGKDVVITPTTDGRIYKMMRYPDTGVLIVYSRAAGDNPMTTITMQRMRKVSGK